MSNSTSPMSNFSTPFYIEIRNSMQHFFTNVEFFAIILHRGSKCNTVFLADAEFSGVFYTETQNMVSIFFHDVHHYTHNFVTTALPTSQLATHDHYVSYYDQLVSMKKSHFIGWSKIPCWNYKGKCRGWKFSLVREGIVCHRNQLI